jgi:carboxyl-terminal processing protease
VTRDGGVTGDTRRGRDAGRVTGKGVRLLAAIASIVLAAACSETLLGPAAHADRSAVFDQIWKEFDLHYSFFEYKNVNWDTIGARYRPGALAAATDEEFASQVAAMLRELKDVHVSLTPKGATNALGYISVADTIATHFSAANVFKNYVPHAALSTGHHLRYGMAADSVGYIRIASFVGSGWAGEIDEALAAMPRATSLIVDVRNNNGGNPVLAVHMAGRFTAKARRYGWVRLRNGPKHDDFTAFNEELVKPTGARKFRGPVFLLTNRRDFSSAEDFVLAMRTIPRITVIGDTTAGASGGPIPRELANGWSYEISEWIEYLPGKRMFEGIGLAPDEFVRATAADVTAGRDRAIERALLLAVK